MRKHDFEKQVQDKLEELSFTPSAPVWQKIEEQIRKQKDKRRIIFWLLPLLLTGIGVWGYLMYHPNEKITKENEAAHAPSISHSDKETPSGSGKKEYGIHYKMNAMDSTIENTATTPNKPGIRNQQMVATTLNSSPSLAVRKSHDSPSVILKANQEMIPSASNGATTSFLPSQQERFDLIHIPINKNSLLNLNPVTTIKITSGHSIVASNKKEKKWQWGAFVYVGSSSIHNSLIGAFNLDKSQDLFAYPVSGGSGTGNFAMPPSPVKRGEAWAAGVEAKRMISRRTSITTGIHYSFFSTHLNVGQRVPDTAGNGPALFDALARYNNSGRINDYQNRYHFLEVPVEVNYQVIKKKPLNIHTGFSIARLIESHALYYNPTRNLYYQTHQYLNKTQVNWRAGISYTIPVNQHLSIEAGPQIQYGLRALQQKNYGENPHLFSRGIRIQAEWK